MVQKAPTEFFASQKKQFWIILDLSFGSLTAEQTPPPLAHQIYTRWCFYTYLQSFTLPICYYTGGNNTTRPVSERIASKKWSKKNTITFCIAAFWLVGQSIYTPLCWYWSTKPELPGDSIHFSFVHAGTIYNCLRLPSGFHLRSHSRDIQTIPKSS